MASLPLPAAAPATTLLFVGTGVSTAIPVMGHIDKPCACALAVASETDKNRRNNVSLMLMTEVRSPEDPSRVVSSKNVLVDCGKTFRDAYFRVLVKRRIRDITALLCTHDHLDAIGGIDDLRDLQHFEEAGHHWRCKYYIPTYLSPKTLGTLRNQVPYIIDESIHRGAELALREDWRAAPLPPLKNDGVRERRATCLDLFEVPDGGVSRVYVAGLEDVPTWFVPVIHGAGYTCFGYVFGRGALPGATSGDCVVYLSDVSEVPEASLAFLRALPRIDLLVVDVLLADPDESHFSHFCLPQAWALVEQLDPVAALGVGMYCSVFHDATNALLVDKVATARAEGKVSRLQSFQLAYDGLELTFNL